MSSNASSQVEALAPLGWDGGATFGTVSREPDLMQAHPLPPDIFANPEVLELRIRQRLRSLAPLSPGLGGPGAPSPILRYEDMAWVAKSIAEELQVHPSIFGDMSQMFWRFDFNGDGALDEEEATKLCVCMLRRYRDATRPPEAGCVRLGGAIRYCNVRDRIAVEQKIGEGGQGAIFLGKDRRSGQQVVVKMYDKSSPNAPVEDITREFELLMSLKHPRIARVFEIFQDQANIYVVQEPYFGGDLTHAVRKAAEAGVRMNERWLAQVIHQVLAGVAFLHGNHVMHCDLKEPNVMITGKADWQSPQVVVIDFGLANEFTTRSHPGGTPGYMPPEVWEYGLWTPKGDVFSLGVMIFSMRTGRQPFVEGCASLEDVKRQTRDLVPEMQSGSPIMRRLLSAMLVKDFCSRPSVAVLMKDPWFSGADGTEHSIDEGVLAALMKRQEKTDLKKALLADLASRENLAQMKELNELFLQLDLDNDGVVSADEVRRGLAGKWPQERIEALIHALVGGEDGEVSYEEFMGQLIAATEPVENELLWRVFSEVDQHKKGYLDVSDISALLRRPAVAKVLGTRDPATLMNEMNRNGSGRVTFEDFKLAMSGGSTAAPGHHRHAFLVGPRTRPWQVGDKAQFFSQTFGQWMNCSVLGIDASTGAVQVDCKPGYWLQGVELQTRLRRPPSLLTYVSGLLNPMSWMPDTPAVANCCGRRDRMPP